MDGSKDSSDSIATLTSSRVDIKGACLKELNENIIETQLKETDGMKKIIEDIEENGIQEYHEVC